MKTQHDRDNYTTSCAVLAIVTILGWIVVALIIRFIIHL